MLRSEVGHGGREDKIRGRGQANHGEPRWEISTCLRARQWSCTTCIALHPSILSNRAVATLPFWREGKPKFGFPPQGFVATDPLLDTQDPLRLVLQGETLREREEERGGGLKPPVETEPQTPRGCGTQKLMLLSIRGVRTSDYYYYYYYNKAV